ncbi:MAG: hypothetical protein Fur0032_20350 [Terrimicrobiaceae bacterium]
MKSLASSLAVLVLASTMVLAGGGDGWLVDYKEALEQAADKNQPILMEFTGSSWCPPCKMMKSEVFAAQDFKNFAAENLVLLELDFLPDGEPAVKKVAKQNTELAEKFQIEGFPTLILLDSKGNELARHVGFLPGGPKALISWVQSETK